MTSSFGTKESVISLICVAACSMPMMKPVASAASRSGAASFTITISACWPRVITTSGVMSPSSGLEARGEHADEERPPVDQHEQHDLERQRDEHRRQHHHAHRHQHAGDDEV